MAEDIQIGADTSGAVSAIGNILKAFEDTARGANVATKTINTSMKAMERGAGAVLADISRQEAARRQNTRAINEEANAVRKLTAENERSARAVAATRTGFTQNSRGQVISAETGRFAKSSDIAAYNAELNNWRNILADGASLEDRLAAMRDRNARRAEDNARRETIAYQRRQRELNATFGALTVAPPATGWRRFADTLNRIPPTTWARSISQATARFTEMGNSARYALYDVSNSAAVAGAAIFAFGALSVRAAIAHERAFANVERTTQTSAAGYEYIRRQLEDMASTLPVTFEEITNIATAAGQLGISASGISNFTSVVSRLSATTNLTSEAAGIALARFRAFFAEAESSNLAVTEATFGNLASSILKVGVNSIASETGIVNVATQIASMGAYAGLTANQVIGLAGALSSIGVAPELARGTITRTFSLIGQAVTDGGFRLEQFASLAGVTSKEFRDAWGTQAFGDVFTQLIKGLNDVSVNGGDANLMLQEMGIASSRDRPLLLRLATAANEAGEAGGLLAQTMADAYAGWVQNAELAIQYNKISRTTSARLQVLGQAFEQLAATMGQSTGGFLGEIAEQLTAVVRGFDAFSRSDAGQVFGQVAVQAALAVGGLGLLVAAGARAAASLQGIGQAMRDFSAVGVTSIGKVNQAFKVLSLSLGVIGIVGSIVALGVGIGSMVAAAEEARNPLKDMDGLLAAMKADAEAGASGLEFYANASGTAADEQAAVAQQAADVTTALYGIEQAGNAGASGMDSLAQASDRARYVFGATAKDFLKSQLLQSETFQNLFKPEGSSTAFSPAQVGGRQDLEALGLDIMDIDWDTVAGESVRKGGDVRASVQRQLELQLRGLNLTPQELLEAQGLIDGFSQRSAEALGQNNDAIQSEIDAMVALEGASSQTFSEIVDGASSGAEMLEQMNESTQKAVDAMAQGFAKFTDTGNLIGLTQQMITGDAEAFEKAWTDAYGGASFSLGDYLKVQERAAEEQQTFVTNLGALGDRARNLGLSDAFIGELAAMGPEANRLVQALVDGTDDQLAQYVDNFGRTGYDASVALATQMAIGQEIVKNIMADGGIDALRAFNDQLASGVGVDAALTTLQRDIDGKRITVKPQTAAPPNLTWSQVRQWERQNSLTVNARVRIVGSTAIRTNPTTGGRSVVISNYAEGGHVRGPGSGTSDSIPANLSNGEFIMTAKATRNIGVGNLYNLMRQAQGGRVAPRRGNNYATGGMVGGGFVAAGNSGPIVVHLAAEDRALLRGLQPIVRIGDRDIAQAQAAANFRTTRQGV